MNPPGVEAEFLLQWGSRKRLRCVRVRGNNSAQVSSPSNFTSSSSTRIRPRIMSSRFLTFSHKEALSSQPTSPHARNSSEMVMLRSEVGIVEKEERYYTTRAWSTVEENMVEKENNHHHHGYERSNGVSRKLGWPKLCIALSSKEKEEDFMAMKGCKLPQRPKKRTKVIQRTLLLASPGAWLTDLSLERYEVREKKICKKKAKGGLKGMGSSSMDSYSE